MKLIVNPHKISIETKLVNEKEINITKCYFEFAEEITNDFVKEAYFTLKDKTYKEIIVNNECSIPYEVIEEKGQVEIGVVAYLLENEEYIKRYNPSPVYFNTLDGSLKEQYENSEEVTPSDKEQIEQAITNLETNKADKSELPDVSNFVTKDVNDLTYYTLSTNTGSSIELSINSSTYVVTLNLKDKNNNTISTSSIDLPLESVVVNGSYDSTNKKIVLTLENGNTIDIPVGDLVNGLQTEITSNNKLSSDLVDDTNNTNKFVTTSEKNTWSSKSDFSGSYNDLTNKPIIPTKTSDLTNNSGFIDKNVNDLENYTKTSDLSSVATSGSYNDLSNKPTIPDELSDLSDDSTHRLVTDTEKTTWNNKSNFSGSYDDLTNKPTIPVVPTNVSAFTNDAGYLTQHQDISGKENITNKVTSMSVSSTDTEYPSAKCVYDALQNAGGGSELEYRENAMNSRFDFSTEKKGIYLFKSNNSYFYYKVGEITSSISENIPFLLILQKEFNDAEINERIGILISIKISSTYTNNGSLYRVYLKKSSSTAVATDGEINLISQTGQLLVSKDQLFSGVKIFGNIPEQSSNTAPTKDVQFTNKKYVDDSISASLGDIESLLEVI